MHSQALRSSRHLLHLTPSLPGLSRGVTPRVLPPRRDVRRFNASDSKGILSAEDSFAIINLCHRFDHAINRLDQQAAGATFASTGTLHTPRGAFTGCEAIAAFFKMVEPMAKGNRHLTVNIVVDAGDTSSTARASSYRLLHKASTPASIIASGVIEDELVKEEGQWKFASRKFIMDPPAAPPAAQ